MGHQLSATLTLFPNTTIGIMDVFGNWTIHLHTTDKSSLMLSQRMDVFSVHTQRLTKSIYTLSKLKRAVIEMTGMRRKTSMHTSSFKADLSDSMEGVECKWGIFKVHKYILHSFPSTGIVCLYQEWKQFAETTMVLFLFFETLKFHRFTDLYQS